MNAKILLHRLAIAGCLLPSARTGITLSPAFA